MTPELRRSLAALLVGITAALVGLTVATSMRGAGSPLRAYVLGAAAALIVAVVLWRIFTFAASRGGRR